MSFNNTYEKKYFRNFLYREYLNSQRNRKRLSELLKYKQNGKLYEIGFGEGNFLKEAKKHFEVFGADISRFAGKNLRKDFGKNVRIGDIQKLTLNKNYYDVVVSFNILEHLKNPEVVIANIFRALNKGGVLIGSVPNNSGILGRILTAIANLYDKTHICTFHPEYWQRLFSEAGFGKIIFFGENAPLRNFCVYVRNKYWKQLSFNLMFVCIK